MSYKKWEPVLYKELKQHMDTIPENNPGNDINHVLRVWKSSEKLGKKLNADMEILIAAAFFHDLGRHYGKEKHGKLSVEISTPILDKICFPEEKRKAVLTAIRFHEYFYPNEKRDSIEAKILSDVDRIDSLGVIGIMRHLFTYYSKGMPIKNILEMVDKRWESIELKESRKIGKKEYESIKTYFEALNQKSEITLSR